MSGVLGRWVQNSHKGFVKGNRKVIQNFLMFDYHAHSEMVDLG